MCTENYENAAVETAGSEGFEEGFNQGFQEGHEQGFEQGLDQGIQIAIRKLMERMPLEEVSSILGVPVNAVLVAGES